MYRRSNSLSINAQNLCNYVEGYDVYNSYLLSVISDRSIVRQRYKITSYEHRPDLIALDFYGSADYCGLVMVQASLNLEDYVRGTDIYLIPKSVLDQLLEKL